MNDSPETYQRAFESISQELSMNGLKGRNVIDWLTFVETEGDPALWISILRAMGYGLDSNGEIVDLYNRS